ncbi:hypothetical protein WVI01_14360 [Weissella viridescens]|nr:hypothetical protein WVI01_14360 [Weissella viridescens]
MVVACKQSNKGDDATILYRPTIVENICQRCLSKKKNIGGYQIIYFIAGIARLTDE